MQAATPISLKDFSFLKGCSPEFEAQLEELGRQVTFKPGDGIFHEGDYADRFYLILRGKVQLEINSDSTSVPIQVLGPGEALGWSWLFPPFEWHFSARASEHCTALELNAASLLERAERNPAFGYELTKRVGNQVVQRLRAACKRLAREVQVKKETAAEKT